MSYVYENVKYSGKLGQEFFIQGGYVKSDREKLQVYFY